MTENRARHSGSGSNEHGRKTSVERFHRDVLGGGRWNLLENLVAPDYRPNLPELETSPRLAAGRDALAARLQSAGPVPNEIRRMIADGDLVYAHVRYPGSPTY